jgi:hypothetical protein
MSRAQKIHPPLKGSFDNILRAVAAGTGKVKGPVKILKPRKSKTKSTTGK